MSEPRSGAKVKFLAYAILILSLTTGCSSMKVITDWDESVDFSTFETFKFRPSDTSLAESQPLVDQRIVAAIKQEMTGAGFTEVESGADLFVTYYASSTHSVVFNTTHMGYGMSRRRWGTGISQSTTTARTFEEGTLVIDVWDNSTDELLWRAVIEHSVSSNPDKNTERINQGISKAFENFPPG